MSKILIALKGKRDKLEFEGDYEVSLSPGNALLVMQDVPDVTAKSKEGVVRKIVAIYNPDTWEIVGLE